MGLALTICEAVLGLLPHVMTTLETVLGPQHPKVTEASAAVATLNAAHAAAKDAAATAQ